MPELKNATTQEREFVEANADELSRSTRSAKWIHSPEEHEDHPGQTLATRERSVIERWAEERGAQPATVPGSRHDGRVGVLRFDFGEADDRLEKISWDDFFETFQARELVMLFQEHLKNGNQSNFFRFDSPHREDA